MAMQDPKRDLLWSLPTAVAPLPEQRLLALDEVKRTHHQARKLATPAYVYTDAAFRDGQAGVAYASRALGERVAVVPSSDSTEGEFWALIMAMYDAGRSLSFWPAIVFRIDCTSVAHFAVVKVPHLKPVRAEIVAMVRVHRQWSVEPIKRSCNARANRLSREAFNQAGTGDGGRRETLLGKHD
jgi:hypothetical protein